MRSATETMNFFWHCLVASRLRDEFQDNTVTKSHFIHAVRKATDCIAGRNGVQYASANARAHKDSLGAHWDQCGLIKEHAVPVSVVGDLVRKELAAAGAAAPIMLSSTDAQGLTPDVVDLFQQHPRAWVAARIIREWTLHARITEEENMGFDNKDRHGGISIRKRMPNGWGYGQDRFARYHACGIRVSKA